MLNNSIVAPHVLLANFHGKGYPSYYQNMHIEMPHRKTDVLTP